MGNAARTAGIMEALAKGAQAKKKEIEFFVITWGAGYLFFNNYKQKNVISFKLFKILSYSSENNFTNFFFNYFQNSKVIKKLIKKIRPDLLILDSDYHFYSYFKSKAPRFSINQASEVLERIKKVNYHPQSIKERAILFFREQLDLFYQEIISSKIIVPSFFPEEKTSKSGKTIKIPLIVRNEFLRPLSRISSVRVGALLSGSEINKDFFLKLKKNYNIDLISPDETKKNLISQVEMIDKFDILLTQGGLSSISESIARRKYLVVFPIHNHPEQIINSLTVESLGLGMRASLLELDDFDRLYKTILQKKKKQEASLINCSGADKVAKIIFDYFK